MQRPVGLGVLLALGGLSGCSGSSASFAAPDTGGHGSTDLSLHADFAAMDATASPPVDAADAAVADLTGAANADLIDAGGAKMADAGDGGGDTCSGTGVNGCYAITCTAIRRSLQDNRDRLIADLAKRKCTDRCTLWSALNQAERYIFLMDTAYLGASSSRLHPPADNNLETALDHATALYSINGPKAGQGVDGSGRGGQDYNRIYLGFDALGECVMRNFMIANPTQDPTFNQWQKSDDVAGPHAPFTQREMIYWYKAWYEVNSDGPQFHHFGQDGDFDQNGIDQRLGVCGVTDRSLTELTIAFDFFHNSDPLGDYSGRGGFGWQIVDQHIDINADWNYTPTNCPVTQPVNMDLYGGGTFSGMGPTQQNGTCTAPKLGNSC